VAIQLFIGLMSGTSLDGVDAALVEFHSAGKSCQVACTYFLPYPPELRIELLALHNSSENELERSTLLANQLSCLYAETINQLLVKADVDRAQIVAIGCHGQTIRHRPELGFTVQIVNPALLTELTDITVVADFRSRDIAAGGQGAPLVPAFHQAVFADKALNRVIINIGGIANLTHLPTNGIIRGFDSGPGNMLMDAWTELHTGKAYDDSGNWASTGEVIDNLLTYLLAEPYFNEAPPKSTGRDLFNLAWLQKHLKLEYKIEDVQRTLLELTARSIAAAVSQHCGQPDEIYLCGGGSFNSALLQRLQQLLQPIKIGLSDDLGVNANSVEAAAFAWLARQTMNQAAGNMPEVTGAKGARILGAIYTH
jgi:anhydro-N-acetylmuramic acid kinase